MISRAQGETLAGELVLVKQPKLSALEKAMLKWAVVDPDDRLLDANIGSGMMAEYLRRNMQCEVCGVSDNMEDVRNARERLQSCDIVYAAPGDIPWKENAFDTVLMKYSGEDSLTFSRMLMETERVLRPGGQLILGTVCYPALFNAAMAWLAEDGGEERRAFQRTVVTEMLRENDFEKVTWQRTSLTTGVMIAWKRNPEAEELRKICS